MKRRQFIVGTALAAVWPRAAHAQQRGAKHRVGLLMGPAESDPEGQARAAAFREGLAKLGWIDGRNIQFDHRWVGGDIARARAFASELANAKADAIMANGTAQLAAAQRATKSIPVVFAQVSDPVGGGFVDSISRPGGNITGCTDFEYSFAVKWLEVLRRIAPDVGRVSVLYDPNNPNSAKFLPHIESAASSLNVPASRSPIRDADDINRVIDAFADAKPGGLIVLPSVPAVKHHDLIFVAASRHRFPVVYPYRSFALSGGLVSYGVDTLDMYRCAATYVDRILKGEKPAELPVQFASRFEFVINLKAAKTIGLTVPNSELLNATDVVE